MSFARLNLAALAALVAFTATPQAFGQGAVEEIIVTARQREETLQDVPVTVSAFTSDDMARYNVQNLADASNLVPAFNIYQGGSGNGSNLFLRGIGSSSISAAFDSSVAISIDGVVGNTGRLIHNAYLDMAQVEVLKGPQSLYFGKSATAGVVSITTQDPNEFFEVIGSVGYETETKAVYTEAVVSGPITDTLAARFALGYSETDELFENSAPQASALHSDLSEKSVNSRLTLLWDPTDKLQTRFKLNYSEYDNDGPASVTERRCVDGSAQAGSGAFTGVLDNGFEDCKVNGTTARGDGQPLSYQNVPHGNTGVPYLNQELFLSSLQIDYQINDTLELTSITAYLDQNTNDVGMYCYCAPEDLATAPNAYFGSWSQNIYEGFTQEIRLASSFDGALNFAAGIFYEDAHQEFNTHQYAVNATRLVGPDPVTGIGSDWRKDHELDSDTWSGFVAGYWDITDTIELTAGVRYTDVQRDGKIQIPYMHSFLENALGFLPAGSQISGLDFDDDNWSPEVAISWHATDEVTLYAAYKTGFKPGGVDNSVLPSASLDPNATNYDFIFYDSEEAKGGEVGVKSTLMEGNMRLNATAYYYVYEDLQVQQFDSVAIQFNTLNAGEMTTQGVEFDTVWYTPIEGLWLRAAWAYTDTEYTDDFPQLDGTNLDNKKREYVPDWAGNIGFTYDWVLNGNWTLSLSGDARYSDSYITDYPDCDPSDATTVEPECQDVTNTWYPGITWEQDSFWTYDAAVRLASERWELALTAVNIDDERFTFSEGAIPGTQPDLSGAPGTTAMQDNARTVNQGRKVTLRGTFRL